MLLDIFTALVSSRFVSFRFLRLRCFVPNPKNNHTHGHAACENTRLLCRWLVSTEVGTLL